MPWLVERIRRIPQRWATTISKRALLGCTTILHHSALIVAQHQDQWESLCQKLFSLDARQRVCLIIKMKSFVLPQQASTSSLILAKQQHTFIFDATIINDVNGDLLLYPNEECPSCSRSEDNTGTAQDRAISVFVVDGTTDDKAPRTQATIQSVLKLNPLIIGFQQSCVVSFLVQTSKLYL